MGKRHRGFHCFATVTLSQTLLQHCAGFGAKTKDTHYQSPSDRRRKAADRIDTLACGESSFAMACLIANRVLHPGASVKIVLHPYLPFTSFKKCPPTVVFHRWAGILRFIVRAL